MANSSVATVAKKSATPNPANTVTANPIASSGPQISGQAKALLSLYASASGYIRDEHMEPYAGPVKGISGPSAFVNVEKYNSYLFEKAAADMVSAAKDLGITLETSEVLAQLREDNSDIASIRFDDKARREKLGPANCMFNLSLSDVDSFTEVYITAQENGLDLNQVGILAFERSLQNRYGDTLRRGADTFPAGWDWSETDPDKIEAAKVKVSESVTQQAAEIRAKLQVNPGLSDDFLQYLLNPKIGLGNASGFSLDFLSKLVDIHNQQNHAPAAASSSPAVTREGQ